MREGRRKVGGDDAVDEVEIDGDGGGGDECGWEKLLTGGELAVAVCCACNQVPAGPFPEDAVECRCSSRVLC